MATVVIKLDGVDITSDVVFAQPRSLGRKTSPKKAYDQMTFEEFWYQETGHYPEWKIDE